MFKKSKIAAATVALLGAVAGQNVSAVAIDESGTNAQVLIFPYYNVNNNFISMFNIRNTHNEYKAIKIRFRESRVSNDALDFNVYLSPWDHYSFYLYAEGDNVRIHTDDNTCSFPDKTAVNAATFTQAYINTGASDLKEGYVEVIEMGNIPNFTVTGASLSMQAGLKHDSKGVPGDCTVVSKAWANGQFTQGGAVASATTPVAAGNGDLYMVGASWHGAQVPANITKPTGGLAGYSALLDSASGLIYAQSATAIRNWQTAVAQHYRSDDNTFYLLPALASGNVTTALKHDAGGTSTSLHTWYGVVTDFSLVDPNLAYADGSNTPRPAGINPFPISDVLAATGLHNDFLMTEGNGWYGKTDWVVTFPMRKHGIFNNYRYDGLLEDSATSTARSTNTSNPKANVRSFKFVDKDTQFTFKAYNREEFEPTPNVGFSPVITKSNTTYLPREANVIQWDYSGNTHAGGSVLGTPTAAAIGLSLSGNYTEGWADITYAPGANLGTSLYALGTNDWSTSVATNGLGEFWLSSTAGVSPQMGVPSIGFAAMKGVTGARGIGETVTHVFKR